MHLNKNTHDIVLKCWFTEEKKKRKKKKDKGKPEKQQQPEPSGKLIV